jgi:glycogen synthase
LYQSCILKQKQDPLIVVFNQGKTQERTPVESVVMALHSLWIRYTKFYDANMLIRAFSFMIVIDLFLKISFAVAYLFDAFRFTYFSRAALDYIVKSGKQPDVLHIHNWETSIVGPLFWDIFVKQVQFETAFLLSC